MMAADFGVGGAQKSVMMEAELWMQTSQSSLLVGGRYG
jgi:hypothetical protein